MNRRFSNLITRLIPALAVMMLTCASAYAQSNQFESVLGEASDDIAHGVLNVRGVADLDFKVIVGETRNAVTGDKDVYVVKVDVCGDLMWGMSYDMGGDDIGYKIQYLRDGTLMLVGTTENLKANHTHDDIFLMKIGATGNPLGLWTFGGEDIEEARDFKVFEVNGKDEVMICGRTRSYGHGGYDAYLIRFDLVSKRRWGYVFGGELDDCFNSCDMMGNSVVAVGTTRSYSSGDEDIYMARIDTAGNLFPGFPTHYGGAGDDVAWSVMTTVTNDIILCGETTSLGGNGDGYLLHTDSLGALLCDVAYGGVGEMGRDVFYDVKRHSGYNLVVTGSLYNVPGGFGDYDMYLGTMDECFNISMQKVHGGPLEDQGYAVADVHPTPLNVYFAAGMTRNFGGGGADAYLVEVDIDGLSGCHDATPEMVTKHPDFIRKNAPTTRLPGYRQGTPRITWEPRTQWDQPCVCYHGRPSLPNDVDLGEALQRPGRDNSGIPIVSDSTVAGAGVSLGK